MPDWKTHGVRIVRAGEFDSTTPQPPGMTRAAAITAAKAGAQKLWAGTVRVDPDARTAAHHHGDCEWDCASRPERLEARTRAPPCMG